MLIYLIGYMASGKSTIGKQLADGLQYTFLDLDACIETAEAKTVTEIFAQYGEAYFRELEKKQLVQTFLLSNTVIACGGGTPCFFDNLEQMQQHGATVWIKTNKKILKERLAKEKSQRPLIAALDDDAIEKKINKQLAEREKFYTKASYSFITAKDNIRNLIAIFAK